MLTYFGREVWIALSVIVVLFVILVWVTHYENKQWEAFKITHECVVVAKEKGDVSTGVDYNGNVVVISEPDKTGWECNDGIIYWR